MVIKLTVNHHGESSFTTSGASTVEDSPNNVIVQKQFYFHTKSIAERFSKESLSDFRESSDFSSNKAFICRTESVALSIDRS